MIARVRSGRALAFAIRTPTTGQINLIKIYVGAHDTATALIAGIYANNSGRVGRRLSSGNLRHLRRGAWNAVHIPHVAVKSGRTYWVAVLGRHGSLVLHDRTARACTSYTSAGGLLTSLPPSLHKTTKGQVCEAAAQADGTLGPTSPLPGATGPTGTAGSTSATPPLALPFGVSLQAIDGGAGYYCSNGFTNACNDGWDNPSFFPIMQDYYYCSQPVSEWLAEGLTAVGRVNSDCSPSTFGSLMQSNHLSVIAGGDKYTGLPDNVSPGFGQETVGWHIEEPVTWNASTSTPMASPNPSVTAAANDFAGFSTGGVTGRFLQGVFTPNQYPNAPTSANKLITGANAIPSSCGSTANNVVGMQSVMTCTSGMPDGQHIGVASLDTYWFAGSGTGNTPADYYSQYCNYLYGVSGCDSDQIGRGSNYGDAIDAMRAWTAAPHVPSGAYIETGNGLVSGNGRDITPPEFNEAAWDEIIHGARMLLYFTESANTSDAGFPTTSVDGTTMAAQGAATDDLVESLAPIINSPSALNYATNNLGGYTFPTEHLDLDNGLDMSVHYYTGSTFTTSAGRFSPGFYIIATPRGSESQSVPITATFTVPSGDDTPTGDVQDVCACSPSQSTGTVSYNSSTHSFTETFNKVGDVHIIGPFR